MAKESADLATVLFEEHVKYELAALEGAKLKKFLAVEVDELLGYASTITLGQIVSSDWVMDMIQRLVVDLEMADGLSERMGDIAAEALKAPVQSSTRLGDIISREQVKNFLEELLKLRQHRERVIARIMAHPVYQQLVANVVYQGLVSYLYEDNLITKSVPGVGSIMKFGKRMANRAVPGLDENLERRLKSWIADSLPGLVSRSEQFLQKALTDDELRDSMMTVWGAMENATVSELQEDLGGIELQKFVVLGYEFWLKFRKTEYFEGCCQAVVDYLLATYGERPLGDLMADVGINREIIVKEVEASGIPLIQVLREQGYIEALLRRRLAPFYKSAAVRKLLQSEE